MSNCTPATKVLEKEGAAFTLHHYDYDAHADRIGMQAAAALGVPAARNRSLAGPQSGRPGTGTFQLYAYNAYNIDIYGSLMG